MGCRPMLVIGVLGLAATTARAGEPYESRRLRAVAERDTLYDELVAARDQAVREGPRKRLQKAADLAIRANSTLDGDLEDVVQINGFSGVAFPDSSPPQTLLDAYAVLTDALAAILDRTLDDFQGEIAVYAASNPEKGVARLDNVLVRARELAVKADEKPNFAQKAIALSQVVDLVRKQKVFPFASKLPRNCFGGDLRLKRGESGFGPWAIYVYDRPGQLKSVWFDANYGSARLSKLPNGDPGSLIVEVGYCDGRNESISSVRAQVNFPVAGTPSPVARIRSAPAAAARAFIRLAASPYCAARATACQARFATSAASAASRADADPCLPRFLADPVRSSRPNSAAAEFA